MKLVLLGADFDDIPTTFVAPTTSCPQLLIDAGCYYQGYLFSHDHQCKDSVTYDIGYTYCSGCYPYSNCGYVPPVEALPTQSETSNQFNEELLWSCTPMLLWNTEFSIAMMIYSSMDPWNFLFDPLAKNLLTYDSTLDRIAKDVEWRRGFGPEQIKSHRIKLSHYWWKLTQERPGQLLDMLRNLYADSQVSERAIWKTRNNTANIRESNMKETNPLGFIKNAPRFAWRRTSPCPG